MLSLPLLACLLGVAASALFTLSRPGRMLPLRVIGWGLSLAPFAAFALLIGISASLREGQPITWRLPWLPALDIAFALYLDGLSLLFGLIVTGIGGLVTIYAGYYLASHHSPAKSATDHDAQQAAIHPSQADDHPTDARFFLYLSLFMTSMLGLVLAGDVITLFVFWEGTSLTSFLLIAYKSKDEEARRGAFKALFITGGGGIALLAGLLFAAAISGSTDLAAILSSGERLRSHAWYPIMLALVAFGAFTKSAQVPFHFWLPSAMAAPTPASAYLHSATMVKAGVYLLARLHPALGNTELWFWLMIVAGGATMLTGAIIGLRQSDLKGLLAYSTISQLGALVMLIGEEATSAFKALAIGILAHALYKGALFMVAGIVDHYAGSRDLRRLGGLWRAMPWTFAVCGLAALSMAGLPPLFGFLAKETLLAAEMDAVLPQLTRIVLPVITVLTGAGMLAQAASLTLDTFVTRPGAGWPASSPSAPFADIPLAHEAPLGMLVGPLVPALLSLIISVLQPEVIVELLAGAASAAYGSKVKVSLELFHGISLPLVLSGVAITLGVVLFAARSVVRAAPRLPALNMNLAYEAALQQVDRAAHLVTHTQGGRIRAYLSVILIALFALVGLFGNIQGVLNASSLRVDDALDVAGGLRLLGLFVAVAASFVSIVIRRDLLAIIALGSSGPAIALVIALEPSPDVALVQVVVDVLSTVVLVLALSRLPRAQRRQAEQLNGKASARHILLATAGGALVTLMCLYAFASRPRPSIVTPYYEQNAKPLTGAADIVGAIVVDFRGFDTLIEITVFSAAGMGVFSLIRYAMKKRETTRLPAEGEVDAATFALPAHITGVGGVRTSPLIRALAYAALPAAFALATVQMIYGHDQPGDGFTAGVILSLGVAFWYVVFGYERTKQRLKLLRPTLLIGSGLLLVLCGSTLPAFLGKGFFSPFDFGAALNLPLPQGFYLSTSFLFELAICLAVLGATIFIIDALGHPERDLE